MVKPLETIAIAVMAATLANPTYAQTATTSGAACTVAVDYVDSRNSGNNLNYLMDFVVTPDAPFQDDFGTTLRQRSFRATALKDGGNIIVAVDFFSDVGVFLSVAFDTKLTIHGSAGIESTAGNYAFGGSDILGEAAGNHTASWTLVCHRNELRQ